MFHRPLVRSAAALLSASALLVAGAAAVPASAIGTPTADFTWSPQTPAVGQTVLFDGTASTPAIPGDTLSYAWDFGNDGSVESTSSTPQRSYGARGIYPVKLTVSDTTGESSKVASVYVAESAPTASISGPANGAVDASLTFNSNAADGDGDALTFAWSYTVGGGAPVTINQTTASIQHAFHAAGTYTLKVVVGDGYTTTSATKQVTIANSAPTASSSITPTNPRASQELTFDASGSTDAETPTALTYDWDFGDGTPHSTAKVAKHTYTTGGTKNVVLTVTDPQGLTDTAETSLVVGANGNPTAVMAVDHEWVHPGTNVHFDSAGSTDAETPQDLTYEWDFGDGSAKVLTPQATHAYAAEGVYTARLKVTDGHGGATTVTKTINVGHYGPTAVYTVNPSPARVEQVVTFDGTGSSDPEGSSLAYAWSYTLGSAAPVNMGTTSTVQWTFHQAGTYSVTLKVTDSDDGFFDTVTKSVTVTNAAPVANATATPSPAYQHAPVTFDASTSTDTETPAAGLSYAWDFNGDGVTDSTQKIAQHTFTTAADPLGTTVNLTVTDGNGAVGTDSVSVTVKANNKPVAAVAAPTPNPTHVGTLVSFDGSGSSDSNSGLETGAAVASYAWDFGDGATSTQPEPTHAFSDTGTFTVTLVVTDNRGARSAPTSVEVDVLNSAPSVTATATPSSTWTGTPVAFGATGSDAETPEDLSYQWTFGDGATSSLQNPSHGYARPGQYAAKVTVTDPQGLSATATRQVLVGQKVACQNAKFVKTGSWRSVASGAARGGSYCDNLGTRTGADTITFKAAGPRVGFAYGRSTKGGSAKVYIDGVLKGSISFRSTTTAVRFGANKVFTGLTGGTHTVRLVVTSGPAYIDDMLVWGRIS